MTGMVGAWTDVAFLRGRRMLWHVACLVLTFRFAADVAGDDGSISVSSGFGVVSEHVAQVVESDADEAPAQESSSQSAGVRLGIVLETADPPALETWLRYHIRRAGVAKVFVCIHDPPDWVTEILNGAEFGAYTEILGGDAQTQEIRASGSSVQGLGLGNGQEECVGQGLARAREEQFDWLLHIDDDELAYVPSGRKLSDVLAEVPTSYSVVHFQNIEAVVPATEDPTNCFLQDIDFRLNRSSFVAYTNGKSAARVAASYGAYYHGPHLFAANEGALLDTTDAWPSIYAAGTAASWRWPLVLHYESCPFARWLRKFWRARNTPKVLLKHDPFPFFRESTLRLATCASSPSSCDVQTLHEFYRSYKSAHAGEQLWAPGLPWKEILSGEGEMTSALHEDHLLRKLDGAADRTSGGACADGGPPIAGGTLCPWRPARAEDEFEHFWKQLRHHQEM